MEHKDNIRFPIQGGHKNNSDKGNSDYYPSSSIPMWLAEIAYEHYSSLYGKDQSLQRLGERGGFGREELICLLRRLTPAQIREEMNK